jgi:GNAT superfamily N-acetyltransferase
MPAPTIRPATRDDAAIILELIRELAKFERAEESVRATVDDLQRDGWGDAPRFEALIADIDGAPVGFALFFHNYSTWEGRAGIYLEDLYVRPEARRSGAGRRLMARLAAIAVERGCARLDLSVLDWNPARRFYGALGIAQMEEWLSYRAEGDALTALAAEADRS